MEVPRTLLGLVEHYSPSGSEQEAVTWLVGRMRDLRFTRVYQDEAGNAVGRMGKGERQIVLLGHIDTVPGQIEVQVREDALYGRGSVDAKGSLAAFVDAVGKIGEQNGWELIVIGAVDEEGDSKGARHLVNHYHPIYAVIGEPSQWQRITLGYKGTAWAKIKLSQDSAHTASNQSSVCESAFGIWQRIIAWCEKSNEGKNRQFDQITPTLREFQSSSDGFQEYADLRIGVRLPVGFSPQDWYQVINTILERESTCQMELVPFGYPISAYRAEKSTPLVRSFLQAIRSQGGEPSFAVKTGTADMNIVAPKWGCPVVAYGPGDSNLDHTPNEHLSIREYKLAVQVLESVLGSLTSDVPREGIAQ